MCLKRNLACVLFGMIFIYQTASAFSHAVCAIAAPPGHPIQKTEYTCCCTGYAVNCTFANSHWVKVYPLPANICMPACRYSNQCNMLTVKGGNCTSLM
jgi:hypothetical protein